jgi:hypothetical protein
VSIQFSVKRQLTNTTDYWCLTHILVHLLQSVDAARTNLLPGRERQQLAAAELSIILQTESKMYSVAGTIKAGKIMIIRPKV